MTEGGNSDPRVVAHKISGPASLVVLLRADVAVQMRNKRSLFLSLALPLIMLFALSAGKRASQLGPPPLRLALSMTVGIVTLGVIGYSTAIARDREHGVFQRLRVTPAPTWAIMCSRLIVQVLAMLGTAVVVLAAAGVFENVSLGTVAYALTLLAVLLGAAVFLSIGQVVASLIPSADTINAVGRFILIPLVGLSFLGHLDVLGTPIEYIARWSPGGAFSTLLIGAMSPETWSAETWTAIPVCMGYAVVFVALGIRWFRWTAR